MKAQSNKASTPAARLESGLMLATLTSSEAFFGGLRLIIGLFIRRAGSPSADRTLQLKQGN